MTFILRFFIFVLVFAAFPGFAFAASYKLTPVSAEFEEMGSVRYHYNVSAGTVISDVLKIERRVQSSDVKNMELMLYAVDAEMTANGFLGMMSELLEQKDLGRWIKYDSPILHMLGEQVIEIPFTIAIPDNATPGQHIGGILIVEKDRNGATLEEGAGSKVRVRYATTVAVNVQGEVNPAYEIGELAVKVSGGEMIAGFDFRNKGNVLYGLAGNVELDGLYDKETVSVPYRTVLPGESAYVDLRFNDMYRFFGITKVRIDLDLSYEFSGEKFNETRADETTVWYMPFWFAGILIFVFFVLYFAVYKVIRKISSF